MRVWTLAAVLLFAAPTAFAQKAYTGTATGDLVVDGKPIPMKYAYVLDYDNAEEAGLRNPGAHRSMSIVLCDRELPLASVADRNAPFSERKSPAQVLTPITPNVAETSYAIVLKLDRDRANPISARVIFPGSDTVPLVPGAEYPDRVVDLKRAPGFFGGTAFVPKAQPTHMENGPKEYLYKVKFRAPIMTEEPITRELDDAAARASQPVAAVKIYMEAGKKGDVDALRARTAQSHQPYVSNRRFIDSLKTLDVGGLIAQVKRVVIRGNEATVVLVMETPTYSQTLMHLVREGGEWKLCWP